MCIRDRVTAEYALFAGINDQPSDAAKLANLLTESDILVNIIPANPLPEAGIQPPEEAVINNFCHLLEEKGLNVQLRRKRGADIQPFMLIHQSDYSSSTSLPD